VKDEYVKAERLTNCSLDGHSAHDGGGGLLELHFVELVGVGCLSVS